MTLTSTSGGTDRGAGSQARAQGVSAEQYARQVLEHDLAPEWLRNSGKPPNKLV